MLSRLVSGAILGAVNDTNEDIAGGRELTPDEVVCVTFALEFALCVLAGHRVPFCGRAFKEVLEGMRTSLDKFASLSLQRSWLDMAGRPR